MDNNNCDTRVNDDGSTLLSSTPVSSETSETVDLGVSLQDKGKQFSFESEKCLNQIQDLKEVYEYFMNEAKSLEKDTDINDFKSVTAAKNKLAQVMGNIEKLQCNKLDAVSSVHLDSGKSEVLSSRRELNASLDNLQDYIAALHAKYEAIPHPETRSRSSSSNSLSSSDVSIPSSDHAHCDDNSSNNEELDKSIEIVGSNDSPRSVCESMKEDDIDFCEMDSDEEKQKIPVQESFLVDKKVKDNEPTSVEEEEDEVRATHMPANDIDAPSVEKLSSCHCLHCTLSTSKFLSFEWQQCVKALGEIKSLAEAAVRGLPLLRHSPTPPNLPLSTETTKVEELGTSDSVGGDYTVMEEPNSLRQPETIELKKDELSPKTHDDSTSKSEPNPLPQPQLADMNEDKVPTNDATIKTESNAVEVKTNSLPCTSDYSFKPEPIPLPQPQPMKEEKVPTSDAIPAKMELNTLKNDELPTSCDSTVKPDSHSKPLQGHIQPPSENDSAQFQELTTKPENEVVQTHVQQTSETNHMTSQLKQQTVETKQNYDSEHTVKSTESKVKQKAQQSSDKKKTTVKSATTTPLEVRTDSSTSEKVHWHRGFLTPQKLKQARADVDAKCQKPGKQKSITKESSKSPSESFQGKTDTAKPPVQASKNSSEKPVSVSKQSDNYVQNKEPKLKEEQCNHCNRPSESIQPTSDGAPPNQSKTEMETVRKDEQRHVASANIPSEKTEKQGETKKLENPNDELPTPPGTSTTEKPCECTHCRLAAAGIMTPQGLLHALALAQAEAKHKDQDKPQKESVTDSAMLNTKPPMEPDHVSPAEQESKQEKTEKKVSSKDRSTTSIESPTTGKVCDCAHCRLAAAGIMTPQGIMHALARSEANSSQEKVMGSTVSANMDEHKANQQFVHKTEHKDQSVQGNINEVRGGAPNTMKCGKKVCHCDHCRLAAIGFLTPHWLKHAQTLAEGSTDSNSPTSMAQTETTTCPKKDNFATMPVSQQPAAPSVEQLLKSMVHGHQQQQTMLMDSLPGISTTHSSEKSCDCVHCPLKGYMTPKENLHSPALDHSQHPTLGGCSQVMSYVQRDNTPPTREMMQQFHEQFGDKQYGPTACNCGYRLAENGFATPQGILHAQSLAEQAKIEAKANAKAEAEEKSKAMARAYAHAKAEVEAKAQAEAMARVYAQSKAEAEARAQANARMQYQAWSQTQAQAQALADAHSRYMAHQEMPNSYWNLQSPWQPNKSDSYDFSGEEYRRLLQQQELVEQMNLALEQEKRRRQFSEHQSKERQLHEQRLLEQQWRLHHHQQQHPYHQLRGGTSPKTNKYLGGLYCM